jgi:hypothetical protein
MRAQVGLRSPGVYPLPTYLGRSGYLVHATYWYISKACHQVSSMKVSLALLVENQSQLWG